MTNLLRNLENGVSDAPAVSVDNNRDDVLNSCIERLNPFGDEALQAQLARNRRIERKRQRDEQVRIKKKYRLMNFQWSAPQTSTTAPSMMMAPNSARSNAHWSGAVQVRIIVRRFFRYPTIGTVNNSPNHGAAVEQSKTNGVYDDNQYV